LYTAEQSVCAGSGWSAVRNQTLQLGDTSDPNYMAAYQAAVAFSSAEPAHAFLNTSTDKWKGCARQSVTMTGANQSRFNFADVAVGDSKIVQLSTQEGENGFACQHALSAMSNVVIEARTCGYHSSNQATQIADKMAAKVPK
jgi:serine/threonine-protein kinase